MMAIPPAKTVRNSLSGILAISESIVDSSIEEAAAATCDVAVVGSEVVSACISSIEGRYRCNEDVFDVIRCLGVVNDVTELICNMHTTITAAASSSIDIPIFRASTKNNLYEDDGHTKFPLKNSKTNKQQHQPRRRAAPDDALECCYATTRSITPHMQPLIRSGIRPSNAIIIIVHDGAD
jgi:hypothetical protein